MKTKKFNDFVIKKLLTILKHINNHNNWYKLLFWVLIRMLSPSMRPHKQPAHNTTPCDSPPPNRLLLNTANFPNIFLIFFIKISL